MKRSSFYIDGTNKQKIFVRKWMPDRMDDAKAVIQIAHGMAEHSERYDDFAEKLVSEGFIVFANDHKGHGKTEKNLQEIGFFAEKNGWQLVVDDIRIITEKIRSEYKSLPVFILGHSMGSFLLRTLMIQNGEMFNGAILSGTGGHPGLLGRLGKLIVKTEILFRGKRAKSKLMTKLSFGAFNNSFKPVNTEYDWLTRDKDIVRKYIDDPLCGSVFSTGFFLDLLNGVFFVNNYENIEKMPESLPVLFISGDKDPVGENGKGVKEVYEKFVKKGMKNVKINLYKDARHEILNEINKNEVYRDVVNWLKNNI